YWESLMVDSTQFPLKAIAIKLFRIVPHAADVERLFSALNRIHTDDRNCLHVETLKILAGVCFRAQVF
ncbi:hypothetical protein FN846DRAFT_778107, partial [Sphaerosporella brunnea]